MIARLPLCSLCCCYYSVLDLGGGELHTVLHVCSTCVALRCCCRCLSPEESLHGALRNDDDDFVSPLEGWLIAEILDAEWQWDFQKLIFYYYARPLHYLRVSHHGAIPHL